VVLLGDSIFDNAAYTAGAPDVATHLRRVLPAPWQVSLLAEDGATIADLARQLRRVPAEATHLVISVGGNDALRNIDLLSLRVTSSSQALEAVANRVRVFDASYRNALTDALALRRTTTVCTVYNGALQEHATAARIALAVFNDAIIRAAIDFRIDVVELRAACTEPADYANPIEPSGQGGLKIAKALARAIGAVPASTPPARAWGGVEGL
jgi:hypothetical protein